MTKPLAIGKYPVKKVWTVILNGKIYLHRRSITQPQILPFSMFIYASSGLASHAKWPLISQKQNFPPTWPQCWCKLFIFYYVKADLLSTFDSFSVKIDSLPAFEFSILDAVDALCWKVIILCRFVFIGAYLCGFAVSILVGLEKCTWPRIKYIITSTVQTAAGWFWWTGFIRIKESVQREEHSVVLNDKYRRNQ